MKILLAEDDEYKKDDIINFLNKYNKDEVVHVSSFVTCRNYLLYEECDLLLLDMSLPHFTNNSNSRFFRNRAGAMILRTMKDHNVYVPTIVVTMYNEFSGVSLENLINNLECNYPEMYKGFVFYEKNTTDWEYKLWELIEDIRGNYEKNTSC